jgi:hypothetical protein
VRLFPSRSLYLLVASVNLLFAYSAHAQATGNWTNPSNNERLLVGSSNNVNAVVTSSANIHVVQLYVNGCKMVQQDNDLTQAYLDQSWINGQNGCTFKSGNNQFIVQALDESNNVVYRETRTVIGVSGASGQFKDADNQSTEWIACQECGGGDAGDPKVPQISTSVSLPNYDGESLLFSTAGITNPESNITCGSGHAFCYETAFWYLQWNGGPSEPVSSTPVQYVKLDFWVKLPTTNGNHVQAYEFETQQRLSQSSFPPNGLIANMAWQFDFLGGTGQLRIFDYAGTSAYCGGKKCWVPTGLVIPGASLTIPHQGNGTSIPVINDGNWHEIIALFHVDATGGKVYHDAIAISDASGVIHSFAVHDPPAEYFNENSNIKTAFSLATTTSYDQMTNGQQLDDDFNDDNISHYVDKLITTYTAAP